MASSSSGSSAVKASPKPSPAPSIAPSTTSTEASTTPHIAPPTLSAVDKNIEKNSDDSSKLRTFVGILRKQPYIAPSGNIRKGVRRIAKERMKFIGVTDIASVRFSLPPQLLEPVPNLEYWNYLDRPETFVSIPDSDDPLGRMLAVSRFWFTKDLKYVKGRPCKPYNSTLGEFFRCNWVVPDDCPPILDAGDKSQDVAAADSAKRSIKVSYLTEQTSHHPPVSAFFVDCPEKGITARGFDQLSAKFTGTSIRVAAGAHNLGIFVTLHNRDDEQYQLTHPAAHLGGFLRGSLNVTVSDHCTITCPKTKIKIILHYLEEGWLGKTQNKVDGVIFRYNPEEDTKNKVKEVPESDVLARIEGCWQDKLYYTLPKSTTKTLLIDLNPLTPVPKEIPPPEIQLPNESRRFWADVTDAIKAREFSKATSLKLGLEERQREKAAERKAKNEEWHPRFFTGTTTPAGRPELTADGRVALQGLQENQFELQPSEVTGA